MNAKPYRSAEYTIQNLFGSSGDWSFTIRRKNDIQITKKDYQKYKKETPIPGVEPGFARWKRTVLTVTLYRRLPLNLILAQPHRVNYFSKSLYAELWNCIRVFDNTTIPMVSKARSAKFGVPILSFLSVCAHGTGSNDMSPDQLLFFRHEEKGRQSCTNAFWRFAWLDSVFYPDVCRFFVYRYIDFWPFNRGFLPIRFVSLKKKTG